MCTKLGAHYTQQNPVTLLSSLKIKSIGCSGSQWNPDLLGDKGSPVEQPQFQYLRAKKEENKNNPGCFLSHSSFNIM